MRKWRIVKITYPDGNNREDGRYPQRLNSIVNIIAVKTGCKMILEYMADGAGNKKAGILATSDVVKTKYAEDGRLFVVTTQNSKYYFEKTT
jgi:hypothetical protein